MKCDVCGKEFCQCDLTRVWEEKGDEEEAILCCDDCLDEDAELWNCTTNAEGDPTWKHGIKRNLS